MTVTYLPVPRLGGGAADFARRGGQLRVSFTPRCQLGCWFCHNEGEIPPRITRHDPARQPRRRTLTAEDFTAAIAAMTAAGIRRVFFTGGEPLLSPLARPVLDGIPAHDPARYTTTLVTNGLMLTRDLPWLAATSLDRVKVSLHYFSDAAIAAIAAGKPGDVARIKAGIEAAVKVIPAVEINLLLQERNEHEVRDIIGYARRTGASVQVIELVGTDCNTALGDRVSSAGISGWLRTIATDEQVITTGTGQGKRVFTLDPITVEVIDASLGRHHAGQCGTCPQRPRCTEGFWALRLDSAGALAPCLLRPDLRLDITSAVGDPAALVAAVNAHLDAFTAGTLASPQLAAGQPGLGEGWRAPGAVALQRQVPRTRLGSHAHARASRRLPTARRRPPDPAARREGAATPAG